jgi:hypothetical protein
LPVKRIFLFLLLSLIGTYPAAAYNKKNKKTPDE